MRELREAGQVDEQHGRDFAAAFHQRRGVLVDAEPPRPLVDVPLIRLDIDFVELLLDAAHQRIEAGGLGPAQGLGVGARDQWGRRPAVPQRPADLPVAADDRIDLVGGLEILQGQPETPLRVLPALAGGEGSSPQRAAPWPRLR